jgi:hypothetical protein
LKNTVKKSVAARTARWEVIKSFPGVILAASRCRLDPVPAKDLAYRLIGTVAAKLGQSSDDAVVSPAAVLSCEADHERLNLARDAVAARYSHGLAMFLTVRLPWPSVFLRKY